MYGPEVAIAAVQRVLQALDQAAIPAAASGRTSVLSMT